MLNLKGKGPSNGDYKECEDLLNKNIIHERRVTGRKKKSLVYALNTTESYFILHFPGFRSKALSYPFSVALPGK